MGGLAGAAEACIITPIECVKIAMQSEKASSAPTGMLQFARSMVQAGGVSSLYSGLCATMAKHTAHSCFYFAAFHETKKFAPVGQKSRAEKVFWDLGSGFVAGCAAATANNPFDVVKTRQQVGAASAVSGHAAAKEFAQQQHPFGLDCESCAVRGTIFLVQRLCGQSGPSRPRLRNYLLYLRTVDVALLTCCLSGPQTSRPLTWRHGNYLVRMTRS